MIIPKEKETELENAYKQIRQVEQQYRKALTDGERYNKIIDIWTHAPVMKFPVRCFAL